MRKQLAMAGLLALPMAAALANHHEEKPKMGEGKTVTMYQLTETGTGKSMGELKMMQTDEGIVVTPDLSGLTPGLHGFHVHENGDCGPSTKDGKVTPGGAAGSHLDLENAKHHDAPWADGHTGDMPALFVDDKGQAEHPVLAPELTMKDIAGKAIIIHAGGDNYSDMPKPLGGGGARVACGLVATK